MKRPAVFEAQVANVHQLTFSSLTHAAIARDNCP
jgi:hypothetical protein